MFNYRTILPTIPEEPTPQEEQIVALQTKVKVLQAEMADIKKLNQELAKESKSKNESTPLPKLKVFNFLSYV